MDRSRHRAMRLAKSALRCGNRGPACQIARKLQKGTSRGIHSAGRLGLVLWPFKVYVSAEWKRFPILSGEPFRWTGYRQYVGLRLSAQIRRRNHTLCQMYRKNVDDFWEFAVARSGIS